MVIKRYGVDVYMAVGAGRMEVTEQDKARRTGVHGNLRQGCVIEEGSLRLAWDWVCVVSDMSNMLIMEEFEASWNGANVGWDGS